MKSKKFMIGTVTVVLLVFAVWLLYGELKVQQRQKADSEAIEHQSQLLESEIVDLEERIDMIESERPELKGTAQIIFPDPEGRVYSDIYPSMQEDGYAGMLAMPSDYAFGKEGRLDLEQIRELTEVGWSVCYYWEEDSGIDQYGKWKKNLEEEGISVDPVVYFAKGAYPPRDKAVLSENGVQICIHHGEGSELVTNELPEGIWETGAVGIQGEQPRAYLEDAVSYNGNIAYTVSYRDKEELYETEVFQSMLSYFRQYEEEDILLVLTAKEALEYRREMEEKEAEWTDRNEKQIEDLRMQIEELKDKIQKVRRNRT